MYRRQKLLVVIFITLILPLVLFAQPRNYIPVVEWTGTEFRVINAIDSYEWQLVNNPQITGSFDDCVKLVSWYDGSDFLAYVVDSSNERVQFFTTNIERTSEVTADFTYDGTGPLAAGEFDHNNLMLANGGVVGGSELLSIDGEVFTRVSDISTYSTGDAVYEIVYVGAAGTGGVFTFPDNTLADGDEIDVEYAYSSIPATDLAGDIDYSVAGVGVNNNGVVDGDRVEINQTIPNNNPVLFDSLVAVARNVNTASADSEIVDIYVLDGGATMFGVHAYKIQNDATEFEWVSSYDAPLGNPSDVSISQSNASNVIAVGAPVAANAWTFTGGTRGPALTQTVRNNALVTDHDYRITCITAPSSGGADMDGAVFKIEDISSGNIIALHSIGAGGGPAYDIDDKVPGMRITLTAEGGGTPTDLGVDDYADIIFSTTPTINEYIFIADTDSNRIRVLKGADNGESATNGTVSDYFQDDTERRDDYGLAPAGSPANQSFVAATRPMEGEFELYTRDGANSPVLWTRVDDFTGSTSNDSHYTFDYSTQVLMFGDGSFGVIPNPGDSIYANYEPVIDVLDYHGTTSSDSLDGPSGIASRWNAAQGWYDVYVSDPGNTRIAKLKFTPESGAQRASMQWVTSIDSAYTASSFNNPTDVEVIEDSTDNSVYLFVCDTGNDRILVYNDEDAENGGDGGDTPPTIYTSITGAESGLGMIDNPTGVSVVQNGNNIDVYVCDQINNLVVKYQVGDEPSLDLDYTELNSLYPYPPTGSFLFQKNAGWNFMAKDYPDSSYIQFYYSDTTAAGQASPILCTNDTYDPTTTQFEWTFSTTPNGAPADGFYLLYARLFNTNGILLAESQSSASYPLEISSNLAQGIGAYDNADEDLFITIQNNAIRQINLNVVYPDSISAVSFNGTYPQDRIQIVDITEGPGWQAVQNQGTIFEPGWNNSTGTFEMNTAVLGSNTGLVSGPPIFTVAIITVQVTEDAISPASRFYNGTMNLINGSWADYTGAAVTLPHVGDLALRFGYAGDIAAPLAEGDRGTPPYMKPIPDGIIGFDDIVVFTSAWNGFGGQQDPIADLGPYTGTIPDIASQPDGELDIFDLMAFTLMLDWYQAQNFSAPFGGYDPFDPTETSTGKSGTKSLQSNEPQHLRIEQIDNADEVRIEIYADNVEDLLAAEMMLYYDRHSLELNVIEDGEFLTNDGSFFKHYERENGLQLFQSRMDRQIQSVNGTGLLASVTFNKFNDDNTFTLRYDLKKPDGRSIEKGVYNFGIDLDFNEIPNEYILCQNYPNPFNPVTNIRFGLPESNRVNIKVYNVLGELVNVLTDSYYQAGYHSVYWDATGSNPGMASGVYIYQINSGTFIQNQKMILLK